MGVKGARKLKMVCTIDSHGAGDIKTEPSTLEVIGKRGVHLQRHGSTLQAAVRRTQKESEYHAPVREACCALGAHTPKTGGCSCRYMCAGTLRQDENL